MIRGLPCSAAALLFLLSLWSAPGQQPSPPGDPFLAEEDDILAMIPAAFNDLKEVTLVVDWIRVPHQTANQLIREQLTSAADGEALHASVEKLIAGKQAARLDVSTLLIRSGQRAKTESILEVSFPTVFDPAAGLETIHPDGTKTGRIDIPPHPRTFEYMNAGRTIEAEVNVSEDGTLIDLNHAPEWIEKLGDVKWTEGIFEVKTPLWHIAKLTGQLLLTRDRWQLAGMVSAPQREVKSLESAAFGPDRVLIFVKGSLPGRLPPQPPPVPGAALGSRQIAMIVEWIEADTNLVAGLLERQPAASEGDALRRALDAPLTDGSARLVETSMLVIRSGQRSKVETGVEYTFPGEQDNPGGHIAALPTALYQDTPVNWDRHLLGTTLEAEGTVQDGNLLEIDLALHGKLHILNGVDVWQPGPVNVKRPRFQKLYTTTQVRAAPGQTALVATLDGPLPYGVTAPAARPRKLLVFVRAIL